MNSHPHPASDIGEWEGMTAGGRTLISFFFDSVPNSSWRDAAILWTPSQTHVEVCLLGDSKPTQANREDEDELPPCVCFNL